MTHLKEIGPREKKILQTMEDKGPEFCALMARAFSQLLREAREADEAEARQASAYAPTGQPDRNV